MHPDGFFPAVNMQASRLRHYAERCLRVHVKLMGGGGGGGGGGEPAASPTSQPSFGPVRNSPWLKVITLAYTSVYKPCIYRGRVLQKELLSSKLLGTMYK